MEVRQTAGTSRCRLLSTLAENTDCAFLESPSSTVTVAIREHLDVISFFILPY